MTYTGAARDSSLDTLLDSVTTDEYQVSSVHVNISLGAGSLSAVTSCLPFDD